MFHKPLRYVVAPQDRADYIPPDVIPVRRPDGSIRSMQEIAEAHFDYVLCHEKNKGKAADILGVGRSTFYRWLEGTGWSRNSK
jgi:hypothetical protein